MAAAGVAAAAEALGVRGEKERREAIVVIQMED